MNNLGVIANEMSPEKLSQFEAQMAAAQASELEYHRNHEARLRKELAEAETQLTTLKATLEAYIQSHPTDPMVRAILTVRSDSDDFNFRAGCRGAIQSNDYFSPCREFLAIEALEKRASALRKELQFYEKPAPPKAESAVDKFVAKLARVKTIDAFWETELEEMVNDQTPINSALSITVCRLLPNDWMLCTTLGDVARRIRNQRTQKNALRYEELAAEERIKELEAQLAELKK